LDEEVILQPFVSEIVSEGEIAFVFFEGIFSHAIKQTPKPRDFRVQYIHGGTAKKIEPERWMIEEATRMLEIALKVQGIEDPLLYARVDCVKRDNKLVVMELELIEPELYFNHEEDAADNFAACLHGRLACGIDSDFGANPGQYPASHVVG
jgi:glutathione synthase/RimK-type ligase-like ATP-grasp enzyme